MEILIINTLEKLGGAARAANRLFKGLNSIGVDAKMLVMYKETNDENVIDVSSLCEKDNILDKVINRVKDSKIRKSWKEYRYKSNAFISDIEKSALHKVIGKLNPDIYHLHWVSSGFVNFKELQRVNKPIVWTMHDCFPFTGICHYFEQCDKYKTECGNCPILRSNKEIDLSKRVFHQKKERYQDLDLHIVSPSRWLAEKAKESKLLGNRPIYVIPNGLDTDVFSPIQKKVAKEALKLDLKKKTILFGAVSSTSDERKGFAYLKKALEMLQNEYESNKVEVLIFGGTNDSLNTTYFDTLYLGNINNDLLLAIIYSAADVMVVPSLSENLSNIIMESLACATPVVGFNIGGNRDMINHKENGYLAEPCESEDLASGIKWCLENNSRNELSEKAREKVLKCFKSEIVAQEYKELYDSILCKNKLDD